MAIPFDSSTLWYFLLSQKCGFDCELSLPLSKGQAVFFQPEILQPDDQIVLLIPVRDDVLVADDDYAEGIVHLVKSLCLLHFLAFAIDLVGGLNEISLTSQICDEIDFTFSFFLASMSFS